MDCIHGLDLQDECLECKERINHLEECKECADLFPDFKQHDKPEVEH